jgi:SAM-dependent methyltransferase
MYSSGDDGSLQYQQQNRQDWMIARQWLRNRPPPGNLILDVGCFDGEFLHTLGGEWERHGVELDQAAAHRAASKGIRMIADDIDHLKQTPHGKRFGCVVAMDVIEHMENPRSFLMDLLEMTLPGGMVIISSGDTESWTWRFMGSRYWYCLFSDHISFINEQWCRWFAREHRVELQYLQRFSHGDSTDRKLFWMDMLKNIAYRISPSLFALLRKQGMGEIDVNRHPELIDSPPLWRTACDHLIVCFINKERRA